MNDSVVDLHCDLLSYLALDSKRTIFDMRALCSYPQLKAGGVKLQTFAIFSEPGPESHLIGEKQIKIFCDLPKQYPQQFSFFKDQFSDKISILPAFEGASGFCNEKEPLNKGLERLEKMHQSVGSIFYISLTWNGENRFGGGVGSSKGLKEDGKELLRFLHKRRIAVDFSHTSDALAVDLLNFIDRENLQIPILASHSNFRRICNELRNLPDEIAKEIIRRRGIIGLVFYKRFSKGNDLHAILEHLEYGLILGGEKTLCFGADFFFPDDFDQHPLLPSTKSGFFPELSDASKYPFLIEFIESKSRLSAQTMKRLTHENATEYLKANILR